MLRRLLDLLEKGEWVEVKREVERLILLPDLDYFSLGRIYRAGGRACLGLSEIHAGIKLFEMGLPYAFRAKDWDTLGFIRHDLGAAYLMLGDTVTAREHFEAYLLDLPRYQQARRLEGRAHYNLGLLYRERKEYQLATAAYRQALHCFIERGDVRDSGDCHQNIAWLLLVQHKADEARVHIDLASGFQEGLPEDFRVEQLILLAFHCQVLGQVRPARAYLDPILNGRMEASEGRMAAAKWVEAQVLADQGQAKEALDALQAAWQYALSARAAHLTNLCADLGERFKKEFGEAAL